MKIHVLFFWFILCQFSDVTNGVPTAGNIAKTGYHKIQGTNGLYKFHDTPSEWDDAVTTCKDEGASLYYAENANEFHIVIRYWQSRITEFDKFFVGIRKSEGVFKTVNDTPIVKVYSGWLPDEPNNEWDEDCVEAWHYLAVWGLNDRACNKSRPFICKIPNVDVQCYGSCVDSTTEDNSVTLRGYYEIPGTNGLYKYHGTPSVWDDAAATCAGEGASLYYAETENEFRTVIIFWQTMRNDFRSKFFVGIRKSGNVFKTINGIPIFNVYNGRLTEQPDTNGGEIENNLSPVEAGNCVEAGNDPNSLEMNVEKCDVPKPFICKFAYNFYMVG